MWMCSESALSIGDNTRYFSEVVMLAQSEEKFPELWPSEFLVSSLTITGTAFGIFEVLCRGGC